MVQVTKGRKARLLFAVISGAATTALSVGQVFAGWRLP